MNKSQRVLLMMEELFGNIEEGAGKKLLLGAAGLGAAALAAQHMGAFGGEDTEHNAAAGALARKRKAQAHLAHYQAEHPETTIGRAASKWK